MDVHGKKLLSNRVMHRYLPSGIMPSRDPDRGTRWRAWDAAGRPLPFDDFPGARALRGEKVVPGIEMLYLQDDGREIWTEVASAPVSDAHGQALNEAMVVVSDIDVRKRAQWVLRENEACWRGLMSGGVVLAMWEVDGDSVAAGADWTGGEWMGEVHPEDRERAVQQVRDAAARRDVVAAAFRMRGADGDWHRTEVRVAPLFNLDGSVRTCIGMIVEVDKDRLPPSLQSDGGS